MSIENEALDEEVEVKPKRGYKSSSKQITGKIKGEDFALAIDEIQKDSYVSAEKISEILIQTMQQAYLEWSYPGLFKDKDSLDPAKELIKCEVAFTNTKFAIYDLKTVTEEDDIVDDAYQISLEDAQEIKSSAKLGDIVKVKFDVSLLDKSYVRRVKQLFQSKLKEASKAAILSVYQDQIGGLIEGVVTRVEQDGNSYEISFGKASGFLRKNNKMPSDRFVTGSRVVVHLSDVSDRSNPPSLVISRTSKEFVAKLLERAIPEIKEGIVSIKAIEREPGKRTKIFVSSNDINVDPVGACVGPESSRIRTVLSELGNEKVDVSPYYINKALQVVEAMKPAVVIGLECPEDFFDANVHYEELEEDPGYEYPKITAIVNNNNQGVAIGNGGVNVRLASRITRCTISVLQSDDAISKGVKYLMISDIEKKVKEMAGIKVEAPSIIQEVVLDNDDVAIDLDNENFNETETVKPIDEVKATEKPVEEVPVVEPKIEVEQPVEVVDPVKVAKEETTKKVEEEKPIEHVEIKNKPKISLDELEKSLTSKKGPSETRSYKKKNKKNDEEEAPSIASQTTAMPIYTEAELEEMNSENESEEDYDEEYDDELSEYDSDEYYKDN